MASLSPPAYGPTRAQSEAPYLDAVAAYAERNPGRFHVPAHKGGFPSCSRVPEKLGEALRLDIPACTRGVDLGPSPTPLERAHALAAEAWGARRTWFLVNGATEGSHIACLALAQKGGAVAVQRNVHSSMVHGLILTGLRPTFMTPEVDPGLGIAHTVTPAVLEDALAKTPDAVGVCVVSPTYFGAVADLRGIVDVCRRRGVLLVVDEAWGAHLRFHDDLPEDALAAGADLVISGTHKLVGSLTQSAMLHLGPDSELAEEEITRALALVRSTSPSSLLLGSLDGARRLAAVEGRHLLDEGLGGIEDLRVRLRALPGLRVLDRSLAGAPGVHDFDSLRLVIDVRETGRSGNEIEAAVHDEADVNLELATQTLLLAHFGLGEPVMAQGLRLSKALEAAIGSGSRNGHRPPTASAPPPEPLVLPPRDAYFAAQRAVPLVEAAGRVSAETLVVYPPGIPNLMPGERVTAEALEHIDHMVRSGCMLKGTGGENPDSLRVVDE